MLLYIFLAMASATAFSISKVWIFGSTNIVIAAAATLAADPMRLITFKPVNVFNFINIVHYLPFIKGATFFALVCTPKQPRLANCRNNVANKPFVDFGRQNMIVDPFITVFSSKVVRPTNGIPVFNRL